MIEGLRVAVAIPALDEAAAIGGVIADLPDWIDRIVVCDNGSTDETAAVARAAGAEVVAEPQRGYGAACLAALAKIAEDPPDVVLFVDADHSDDPREADLLLRPILDDTADMVIGDRTGTAEARRALTPVQRFGNALAGGLIGLFWGVRFRDLGPFRAIRREALDGLAMADRDFGWTVEMQVKAARRGLRCVEVPVSYRLRRAGRSKVSGTLNGVVRAGTKILWVIARSALAGPRGQSLPRQTKPGFRNSGLP